MLTIGYFSFWQDNRLFLFEACFFLRAGESRLEAVAFADSTLDAVILAVSAACHFTQNGEEAVLDWISESILALVHSVPAVFVSDEHHFFLLRGFFALLVIVLIVYVVAMWPFGKQSNKKENGRGRRG